MISLKNLLRAGLLCVAAGLTLASAPPVFAQRGNEERDLPSSRANPQFLAVFRTITAEASKSTVRILCDGKEAALGTIVGEDGWILTKYSLLSGKVSCKTKDDKTLEARIVGVHEPSDLAMLKVEATKLPAIKLTESKNTPVGSWLVSVEIGSEPIAVGVLSVATRTPPPVGNRPGGPPQAPSNSYLGVGVTGDGDAAKVERVWRDSPADKAGVKVNDKIVSIQGKAVTDRDSLVAVLGTLKPGDLAKIKLVRDGKETEVEAKLERSGMQAGRFDQNQMGSELSAKRTGFPTYFQHDSVIKPKDCGGPICDLEGHVLGINIARAGRVESYSIPTEAITPLLDDLKSGKLAPKEIANTDREKKIAELKAGVTKAEENKAAAEKKLREAQEALKKLEVEKAAAEKKVKESQEALDKATKELKDKK
jgi:serine protease Do